jgi:hypothetical protein
MPTCDGRHEFSCVDYLDTSGVLFVWETFFPRRETNSKSCREATATRIKVGGILLGIRKIPEEL